MPALRSVSGSRSVGDILEVEEHEASQPAQSEVGSLVRQLFHLSALNWVLIKNARAWIGQIGRVTYHAYIRGEVPFARPRAKPARPCPYRRLAITPSRHPGLCLLLSPRAIRMGVPAVTYLRALCTGRLDTHRSRQPRTHFTTAVRRPD